MSPSQAESRGFLNNPIMEHTNAAPSSIHPNPGMPSKNSANPDKNTPTVAILFSVLGTIGSISLVFFLFWELLCFLDKIFIHFFLFNI